MSEAIVQLCQPFRLGVMTSPFGLEHKALRKNGTSPLDNRVQQVANSRDIVVPPPKEHSSGSEIGSPRSAV
jgi:hypothetical protein